MAHVAKYARAATGHLCAHYGRTADHIENENIDAARSKENYNLGPAREISQVDFIQQRTGEVQCMNRENVKVMCSWVLTAPKDLPAADTRKFFEESYKFLAARYGGEQNVISAYVHMDEITPHLHFAFVPVVADRRKGIDKVSAKECVTKRDLQLFHTDLEKHLFEVFGREVGILNDATKDGNKNVAELKKAQAAADLEKSRAELTKIQDVIKCLQATESGLQAKIEGLQGQLLTRKGLESIKPERTVTGAVKGVSVEQVQDLKKTAVKYFEVVGQNKELKREYDELKQEYQKIKRLVPTIQEQLAQGRSQQDIKDLKGELQKAYDFIARVPEAVIQQIQEDVNRKESQSRGQWSMEL